MRNYLYFYKINKNNYDLVMDTFFVVYDTMKIGAKSSLCDNLNIIDEKANNGFLYIMCNFANEL